MEIYNAQASPEFLKGARHLWGRKVSSVGKYIKKKFDEEVLNYIKMFRHEFKGILPGRFLKSDAVDVNVIYPIIKTLLPNLYFQDPKVFVKSLQEKIVVPVRRMVEKVDPVTGIVSVEEVEERNPLTGDVIVEEFDGVRSGLILQNALNHNIRKARLKPQAKSAIVDAHIGFYGAIKTGWDNEQGVFSMGPDAPPTHREDVHEDMSYGIRLAPWNVVVDMEDFYNPKWIAIRYTVHPDQLKADARLQHTDKLKGAAKLDEECKEAWSEMKDEDMKRTEYYELYVKPCAQYPRGFFALFTEEVPDDFLYHGEWPYKVKEFPVKLIYFNPDPRGGLPIPDVRYYANHQKAKLNLRNVLYEFVQRTLPIFGINIAGVKDQTYMEKAVASGQIPRVVKTTQPIQNVLGSISFNGVNPDFHRMEALVDDDVSLMTGVTKGVQTGGQSNLEFASAGKEAAQHFSIRQNERADIVRDFMKDILTQWAAYYQEFGGDENYTPIEGEKFPTKWSAKQIQGMFEFDIKPFSMNYEDPVIRRRQWVDLLNLLGSPVLVQALGLQGVQVDFVKIVNRILETYDERDVESFIIDEMSKPENQVAHALEENQALLVGAQTNQLTAVKVMPTDNHKLHILVHGIMGEVTLEHIMEHQAAMASLAPNGPGGGNPEGLPINGAAADQEALKEPLTPSPINQKTAIAREATKPTKTR
jgi:hypothetical protein